MTGVRATSLRVRLSLAFVAIAALAVGLATLLSTRGLEPRLTDAAEARLARSVESLAETAAKRYRRYGRWTGPSVRGLQHLGLTAGVRLVVVGRGGLQLRTPAAEGNLEGLDGPGVTSRPIMSGGKRVGTLRAAPVGGSLLDPTDVDLRDSLNSLHMLAGAIASGEAP